MFEQKKSRQRNQSLSAFYYVIVECFTLIVLHQPPDDGNDGSGTDDGGNDDGGNDDGGNDDGGKKKGCGGGGMFASAPMRDLTFAFVFRIDLVRGDIRRAVSSVDRGGAEGK